MIITGLVCTGCGAALQPQGSAVSIKCPYCDTVNLIRESTQERPVFDGKDIAGASSFELNDPKLHKIISDVLSTSKMPPLDVYTNCVVRKITKIMVPAYWFSNVSGMGTAQYEKGMEREYSEIVGSGDDMHAVQKTRTEWFPMSMSVNDTCNFVVAGNSKYEKVFSALYGDSCLPRLVDANASGLNEAEITEDFNINDGDAFNRLVKPAMESHLRDKAVEILGYSDVRSLQMVGAGIMKGDVKKIMLAVYEVVIEYAGNAHRFYLSDDGTRKAVDTLPVDQSRVDRYNSLKEEINNIRMQHSNALKLIGWIMVAIGVFTIMAFIGLFILAGGIVMLVIDNKNGKAADEAIDKIEAQMSYMYQENAAAKQSFIYEKNALPGVLNGVSGDPSAF